MNNPEKRILNCKDPEKRMRMIVRHFSHQLYAIIRPLVYTHENADDVLQETLLKIHKNIDRFQGKSKLFTWMYRIAYNESMQFLRKNRNMYLHFEESHLEWLENTLKADPWFDGGDAELRLQKAIEQLPPRRAEVFRLKYFSGLKYEEIAEILNLSIGALKTHYHLAVRDIKKHLSKGK